jgi:hypothetical protein
MTREALRAMLLDGADNLRNSVVWRFMSPQQRNMNIAARQFWSKDNGITNAALDDFATIMATMQAPALDGTLDELESYVMAFRQLFKSCQNLEDVFRLLAAIVVMILGDKKQ